MKTPEEIAEEIEADRAQMHPVSIDIDEAQGLADRS